MKAYFKKICAAVVAVLLIMSCSIVSGADDTESYCSLNSNEIAILRKLEIITSDNPDFSAEIKRCELAYLITKLCNITPNADAAPNAEFYDLTTEHRYFPEINECIGRGIFSGDGTGFFRPEDTATFNEACKVFSVVLGYKIKGYMSSYVETARTSGITNGITFKEKLTLGMLAEMAYNTLHAGMLESTTYGSELNFEVNENYTAIEHYHGLKYGEGIVDGVYGTTLSMPGNDIDESGISIDGKLYQYEGGEKFFGRRVIFYTGADKNAVVPEIKFICADVEKNTELSVDADDIKGKLGESFIYYSGSKEKKVKFSDIGDVIINGVSYPEYTDADFTPKSGTVTLIDNNNDRIYDVAIIDEIEYMIVGAVDLENRLIYDKNDYTNILGSKTNDNVDLRFMRGNKLAHMSLIVEGSAVSVRKSRNADGIVRINVCIPDSVVSGRIDSLGEDYIGIDGEWYKMARNVVCDRNFAIGDVVDLSVFDERVGVVVHKQDGYMYGYLVNAAKTDDAFNPVMTVMLMTSNCKEMRYECVENVKIDETVRKDINEALSLLATSASSTYQQYSSQPYSQPIRYKVNGMGEISHIDTLTYNTQTENEESLQLHKSSAVHRYYASSNSFYTDEVLEYAMSSVSTSWIVPRSYRADEEWYSIGFSNNGNYVVEAYNVDEYTCAPKLLVGYAGTGESLSVSSGAIPYIVTDVQTVLDEDGEALRKVTVVGNGTTPMERLIDQRVPDIELKIGDVIRFNGGSDGKIIVMERILSAGQVPPNRVANYGTITGPEFQAQIRYAYGTAIAHKDGVLIHTTSITDDDGGVEVYADRNAYRVTNSIPIWVYDDSREPSVAQGLWSDIITYEINKKEPTRVLICTTSGTVKFVYICK